MGEKWEKNDYLIFCFEIQDLFVTIFLIFVTFYGGMNMGDCIFCKIIKGEIPSKKVYEDKDIFAFEDVNPQAPVHVLIVPKKHIEKSLDATGQDKELIGSIFMAANKLAKEKGIAESGFRLVVNCNRDSGQEVFHIHFHLLGGRKMKWPPG